MTDVKILKLLKTHESQKIDLRLRQLKLNTYIPERCDVKPNSLNKMKSSMFLSPDVCYQDMSKLSAKMLLQHRKYFYSPLAKNGRYERNAKQPTPLKLPQLHSFKKVITPSAKVDFCIHGKQLPTLPQIYKIKQDMTNSEDMFRKINKELIERHPKPMPPGKERKRPYTETECDEDRYNYYQHYEVMRVSVLAKVHDWLYTNPTPVSKEL